MAATILVLTRAQVTGGELAVDLKVLHVGSGQTMASKRYTGRADNPRMFAHQASDEVTSLTQNRGVARTRIAFTCGRPAGATCVFSCKRDRPGRSRSRTATAR